MDKIQMSEELIYELSVLIIFSSGFLALALFALALLLSASWMIWRSRRRSWIFLAGATVCIAASLVAAVPALMMSRAEFAFTLIDNQKKPESDLCRLDETARKFAVSYSAVPNPMSADLFVAALAKAETALTTIKSRSELFWFWDRIYTRLAGLAPKRPTSEFHLKLPEKGAAMGSFSMQFKEKVIEIEDRTPEGSFALSCRRSDGRDFVFRPFSERIYDLNLLESMTFHLPDACISDDAAQIDVTWEHWSDYFGAIVTAGTVSNDLRSPEWTVDSPLAGYLPKDNYLPGETIKFHLASPTGKTDLVINHVGLETRPLFATKGIIAPHQRITHLAGRDGVDWPAAYSFLIPEDWRPGYYQFHLDNGEKHAEGYFVISAVPERKPKLALIAATNTWQAYNSWGGQSLYRAPVGECIGIRNGNKVSLNRPYLLGPAFGENPTRYSHLAQAESLLGSWLDRKNIPFDLITDKQLHDTPSLLDDYDVVMLAPHPEYWTAEMRGALEDHIGRGASVVYAGGNGLYGRVSFGDGQMEGYNPRQFHEHDGQIGGFFYLNDLPQSAILGVQYDSRGYLSSEPYLVMQEEHWVFENTGLKQGERFGTGTIAGERIGAAGLETDKRTPASPSNTILLARGDGDSLAEMTIYDLPGGGFVFAAGSINFVLTLDQDEMQSQILENVMRRALGGP